MTNMKTETRAPGAAARRSARTGSPVDIEISAAGPRDGLQSIAPIMATKYGHKVATKDKKAWIRAPAGARFAGLQRPCGAGANRLDPLLQRPGGSGANAYDLLLALATDLPTALSLARSIFRSI